MDEEREKYRAYSLSQCDKQIRDLTRNQSDADRFFGGEVYKAYVNATEKAIDRVRKIRNKIRNL